MAGCFCSRCTFSFGSTLALRRYLYRIETQALEGFQLVGGAYRPRKPDATGRFWSEKIGLDLGLWQGWVEDQDATWIRLFDREGRMIPTSDECAEAERQRAEAAEAEVARLRARLGEGG